MIYISKGKMVKAKPFTVTHAGKMFELDKKQAMLWTAGFNEERGYGILSDEGMRSAFNHLINMGLIEYESEMKPRTLFKMLCNCILVPIFFDKYPELTELEKEIYIWLTQCGAIFTTAELVAIRELNIHPNDEYIGFENYQKLISKIYLNEDMGLDQTLEYNMMFVDSRDEVVSAILSMVRKGAIVLA